MPDMITEASEEDLPAILELQRSAFREEAEHVGDMDIKPMSQTLEGLREELAKGIILKYVRDGRILGSVRAWVEGDTCHIGRLVVDPQHWGRGIGHALMGEVEKRFPRVRRYELFTRADHQRNRPFYASLGYVPVRTERHSDNLTFVYLEKVKG